MSLAIKKRSILNKLVYFIMILVVISSGSWIGLKYSYIVNFIIILLSFIVGGKFFLNKTSIIVLLSLLTYIYINNIVYPNTFVESVLFSIRVLAIFMLIYAIKKNKIEGLKIITNIIFSISFLSLILYLLKYFFLIQLPFQEIEILNKTYKIYLFLLSTVPIRIWGIRIYRNASIFWEPGVFQIYLNFALVYLLFVKKKINFFKIIIILISIITTMSTTGIFLSGLIITLKIIFFKVKSVTYLIGKFILIIFVMFILIPFIVYFSYDKIGSISYSYRIIDILISIKLWSEKLIFGWGFLNYDIFRQRTGLTRGNSNGLFSLLYQGGIFMFTLYFTPIFIYILNISKSNRQFSLALLVFVIISNLTAPIIYSNFIIIFVAYGSIDFFDYIFKYKLSKNRF